MARPNTICYKCSNYSASCNDYCKALSMMIELVRKEDNGEKVELVRQYKKKLNFIYAEPDEEMESLGNRIINKFPELSFIKDYEIKIGYVRSNEKKIAKGKAVYGSCKKLSESHKAYLPFDYIITFYDRHTDILNDNQKKILMLHELKHIKLGDRGLTVEYHDVEDFYTILKEYGIDWSHYNNDVPDILEGE